MSKTPEIQIGDLITLAYNMPCEHPYIGLFLVVEYSNSKFWWLFNLSSFEKNLAYLGQGSYIVKIISRAVDN